jgi:hypothetical protein
MRRYDETGVLIGPASQAELDAIAARVKAEDEERTRNARGWDRLCGMAGFIGGPAGR